MRAPLFAAAVLAIAAGCTPPPETPKSTERRITLMPAAFDDLPGWQDDRQGEALAALLLSCDRPSASGGRAPVVTVADWTAPCAAARGVDRDDDAAARVYFETWFQPYRAAAGSRADGLFTGYFEAELHGARQRGGRYTVPIYRLPDDHVSVDLARFDAKLAGRHIVGRVEAGALRPYHGRGKIGDGALAGRGLELLWVDDEIDAFVLHVQGSGRVILPDGAVVRVGYAGNNGLAYRSIGRALIARGALPRGGASWDDIRAWIDANRDAAAALLAVNNRYIFFRELDGAGPVGGAGVALTARRSLAVDTKFVPYGVPVWLDTVWPNDTEKPLRRLMVAQDTGAAIRGPVRGDFFWGYGPKALAFAGKMKSRGRYFVLLPRAAAARMAGS
jgi:membrane-bound lytic murein transglycosylase A